MRYGLNPKTVAKWKKRHFVHDAPMRPKEVRSTVLSKKAEAMIVAIDRPSKFAFAALQERATRRIAADVPLRPIEAVPSTIHIVPSDNGTHFTTPGHKRSAARESPYAPLKPA